MQNSWKTIKSQYAFTVCMCMDKVSTLLAVTSAGITVFLRFREKKIEYRERGQELLTMSSRKQDYDNDQPPKRSKLLEGNVPIPNEDAIDANDGARGQVAAGKIAIAPPDPYSEQSETTNVAMKKSVPRRSAGKAHNEPDSKMKTDNEETLEEPPHVSKATLSDSDGVQSTAAISPAEEEKYPQGEGEGDNDEDELAQNPMCDTVETLEESTQVSMETLEKRDGVQSTAAIFPEEEVKQPQGGEDEDDLAKNPMHNELILKRMFALCPLKDLKKFRLVCKRWKDLTLQRWRSEFTQSFKESSLGRYHREFWYNPPVMLWELTSDPGYNASYTTTVQKFLHYVHNPDHDCNNRPFRRFHLSEWRMMPLPGQMDLPEWQMHQFYSMCAQNITHLQLDHCKFRSVGEFREVCFRKFPNLQRFVLSGSRTRDPVESSSNSQPERCQTNLKYLEIDLNHGNLPITWLELLSHYPNLTGLKVYNARDYTVQEYLTAINIIRRKDPRLLKITDLDILGGSLYGEGEDIPSGVVLLLRDVKLPVEKLTMHFGSEWEEGKIKDILTWFAPTLKKLDAYRGPISFPYRNFPFGVTLEWLEELVMSDRLCKSIGFLRFTPNLKKLWICDGVEDRPPMVRTEILQNTEPGELTNVKLSSVVELRFDYVLSVVLPETRLLIDTFPNVKKLRMPLNNDQFKLVCEGWRDTLVELEVLGNLLTDSAITGLSAEDVKNFNEAEERNWMEGVSEGEEFSGVNLEGAVVEHPNLTDLTYLRSITMVNGVYTPTRLMDCSAFYGFLKLPRLESLKLHSLVKERAQKALKAKLYTAEFIVPRRKRLSDSDD